ncbi:MAG: hypothetical protein GC190_20165 [Alphaproteobacteria bacterium]|nr:hypothetical protein [Alphaproteobacteria bacterium]
MRDLDERPKRIQRREKLLAERRALEAATGIAFTPADPMGERRFQISRYVDAYAEGELAFKDLERQAALRAIADDAERNLAERFNYSPRVTLTRVLARLKADL